MGSFSIGRIAGIDIRIHWSWFAILALLVWSLADGFFEEEFKDWSSAQVWTAAVITSLLFFTSVLIHEISHSLVARRVGLPVTNITLFIFGGISALGAEPERAGDEFKVAIVGPLTSFALGAFFAVVVGIGLALGEDQSPVVAIAEWLAVINVVLGVFNLLPGFPLDGGRVLRSAFWARTGSLMKATRWAASGSTMISFGLIAVGVIIVLTGAFISGIWLIVIGWFLRSAAESSYQQLVVRRTLEGLKVRDLVRRDFHPAAPDTPLSQIVNEHILGYSQRTVPILVEGELYGLVTVSDLKRVPSEEWATTSAFRAMTPREKLHVVSLQEDVSKALEIMAKNEVHQVPVLDGRHFLGFITRADVLRLVQLRSELSAEVGVGQD